MFNIMCVTFDLNYTVEKRIMPYMMKANGAVAKKFEKELNALPEVFDVFEIRAMAVNVTDADFVRIVY